MVERKMERDQRNSQVHHTLFVLSLNLGGGWGTVSKFFLEFLWSVHDTGLVLVCLWNLNEKKMISLNKKSRNYAGIETWKHNNDTWTSITADYYVESL